MSKTNKSIHDFFVKGPATREAAEHDEARESFAKTNDDVTEEVGDFLSNTMCDLTKEKEMNVEAGDDTSNSEVKEQFDKFEDEVDISDRKTEVDSNIYQIFPKDLKVYGQIFEGQAIIFSKMAALQIKKKSFPKEVAITLVQLIVFLLWLRQYYCLEIQNLCSTL